MLNPEALLLPSLRASLRLPPPGALQLPQLQRGQGPAPGPSSAIEELVAGLTAADLADWDNWDEDGGWQEGGRQAEAHEEVIAVEWDAPPSPHAATGLPAEAGAATDAGAGSHSQCGAPAKAPADAAEDAGAAVLVQFDDYADSSRAEEEAQGQHAPPLTATQLPWRGRNSADGSSLSHPDLSMADGWHGSLVVGLAPAEAGAADLACAWNALDSDGPGGSSAAAQGPAAAAPVVLDSGDANDPWAVLQAADNKQDRDPAVGQAASVSWPSPSAGAGMERAASLSSSPACISMEADDTDKVAASFGGWGCFDDLVDDCSNEQAGSLQEPPQVQQKQLAGVAACCGVRRGSTQGTARCPMRPQPAPPSAFSLDWQYDDDNSESVPPQQARAAVGGLQAHTATREGSSKRRHEQIGEEIIQASGPAASVY